MIDCEADLSDLSTPIARHIARTLFDAPEFRATIDDAWRKFNREEGYDPRNSAGPPIHSSVPPAD